MYVATLGIDSSAAFATAMNRFDDIHDVWSL
jgi:hypothetical protein